MPPLQYKRVYFGRVATIQLMCPKCQTWQFEASTCSECNYSLHREVGEVAPTEYRSEIPSSWRDRVPSETMRKVYVRDEFVCQYCGQYCYDSWVTDPRQLTLDHMTPRAGGGKNTIDNLITCCRECNGIKGNRRFNTFDEARDFILTRKRNYDRIP